MIDITLILLPSRNQIHDYGYIHHQKVYKLTVQTLSTQFKTFKPIYLSNPEDAYPE